jgi:hypothetical protein
MPHRRRRSTLVVAAALVAAGPLLGIAGPSPANATPTRAGTDAPTDLPDIVLPLRSLTGLDLPDLRLSGFLHHPIRPIADGAAAD